MEALGSTDVRHDWTTESVEALYPAVDDDENLMARLGVRFATAGPA